MINQRYAPQAAALLRISLGVMYIAHSVILKYFVFTLAGTANFFASIGYPSWLAYVVFFGEAIGGALLVLGIYTRYVAVALIPILVGALMTHAGNGWVFSAPNGGWAYPLFLIIVSVVAGLLGDGAYAVKSSTATVRPAAARA